MAQSAYYAVFFNQSVNLGLQDAAVREALSAAVDRTALIATALGGYGTPKNSAGSARRAILQRSRERHQHCEHDIVHITHSVRRELTHNAGWTITGSSTFRSK